MEEAGVLGENHEIIFRRYTFIGNTQDSQNPVPSLMSGE
jgi:hypothetical protein